jgi:hypothetical protein
LCNCGVQSFLKDPVVNKELYNGILIIHPIVTYIAVVMYLTISDDQIFLKNIKYNDIKKRSLVCILTGTCAVLLGSL